jgi:hypothetical protein
MSATTEKVFVEALSRPTRERASLVHKLLLSLEGEDASAEIESAWKREALERCEASDEGKITECAAEDVLHDAYCKIT